MSKIQEVLVETAVEKAYNAEIQQAWDEYQAREESRGLARISKVLISIWQLPGIILKLAEGQSLVIDRDGNMMTGRVKHPEKLTQRREKLVFKRPAAFDNGMFERTKTKSSVYMPGPTWKNSWDKIKAKLVVKEDEWLPFEVGDLLMEMDEIPQEELTIVDAKAGNGDFAFTEITWSKHPNYTVGISQKLNTLRYWRFNGEIHWLDQ